MVCLNCVDLFSLKKKLILTQATIVSLKKNSSDNVLHLKATILDFDLSLKSRELIFKIRINFLFKNLFTEIKKLCICIFIKKIILKYR